MRASEFINEVNWRRGLATAALAGATAMSPVHAEHLKQLTPQQFEQALSQADAEYSKTGSAQPYETLKQRLIDSWDLKDDDYYQLIIKVGKRAATAKREHPFRNGKTGQIYHGERSIVPHI